MDVQYIEEWATVKLQSLADIIGSSPSGLFTPVTDARIRAQIGILNELLEEIGRKAEEAEMGRQAQNDMV